MGDCRNSTNEGIDNVIYVLYILGQIALLRE
jgi:hypothetical protein